MLYGGGILTALRDVGDYIAKLPTAADVEKMDDPQKKVVADRRRWALVYFALSLAQNTGQPPVPTTAGFRVAK